MIDPRDDSLVAVILAAGAGDRLQPLTTILPKALCPVGNVPLIDLAMVRAHSVTSDVAVNIHHGREALEEHLFGLAHLSIERPEPLGTAGALGKLRDWIAGQDVLVLNADGWHGDDLSALVSTWDGRKIRLLTVPDPLRGDFGPLRYCGAALMPWEDVAALEPEPSGLYDVSWAPAKEQGRLEFVTSDAPFYDCGTIRDYHAANMTASGGENVVGRGAVVEGAIERTVLWGGVHVGPDEHLVDAIRARDDTTVYATAVGVNG